MRSPLFIYPQVGKQRGISSVFLINIIQHLLLFCPGLKTQGVVRYLTMQKIGYRCSYTILWVIATLSELVGERISSNINPEQLN